MDFQVDLAGVKPPEVLDTIARQFEASGNFIRAAEYWEAAIRLSPSESLYAYRLGKLYLNCAEFKKAVKYLEKACALLPSHITSRFLYAKALACAKDYSKASKELHAVLDIQPQHPSGINLKLCLLVLEGKFSEALKWSNDQKCCDVRRNKIAVLYAKAALGQADRRAIADRFVRTSLEGIWRHSKESPEHNAALRAALLGSKS